MSVDAKRAKEIFLAACEEPVESRRTLLGRECGTDLDLRLEVESLLRFHDQEETLGESARPEELSRLRASLDRYVVEERIGSGGMATVYRAHDPKHDRKVALKVLHPEVAEAVGSERFVSEIGTTANLQHPHILPLLESGEVDGLFLYVTPHVEGGSLRERIERDGALPIGEAVRIVRDVADALDYAHRSGVLHRDIKPGNVLLSDRHALVADFGIARVVMGAPEDQRRTGEGVLLGTPAYMAPEQVAADPGVDHRADIYALGTVAYEALTGRPPFVGEGAPTVLAAQLAEEPVPVRQHRNAVPKGLETVVMRCLEKDPARRWQSASVLLAQLDSWAVRLGGGLDPSGPAEDRWWRRRGARLGTAAAAVMLAGSLGAVTALLTGEASPSAAERVVVLPLENRTGDPLLEELGVLVADHVAQVMQQVEYADVLPSTFARQYVREAELEGADDIVRAVAARAGADFVVTGSLFGIADSLGYRVEILDIERGNTLQHVEETWPRDLTAEAIRRLADRAAGGFALRTDPVAGSGTGGMPFPVAPTLAAYRAHRMGHDLFDRGEVRASVEHHLRAYRLDTTLVQAVVSAAWAAWVRGDEQLADSLMWFADARRGLLNELGELDLDQLVAHSAGDYETSLRAVRQKARLFPDGYAPIAHASVALSANRPREAIEALRAFDPYRDWTGETADSYWRLGFKARHRLGDHEGALEVARRGREQFPDRRDMLILEVRALAALGRVGEVMDLLDEARRRSPAPAFVARRAGQELRAHGYHDAARAAFTAAVDWLSVHPPVDSDWARVQLNMGQLLYFSERWREARAAFRALASDQPGAPVLLAWEGRIAARLGEIELAREVDSRLAEAKWPGRAWEQAYERARLAAILEEPDRAVGLLRDAFAAGMPLRIQLHREMDLEALRGRTDYQDLVRPRG